MNLYPVDLHLHSYYSDGSEDPKTIIQKAYDLGLHTIAICDHDTYTCTPELIAYAKEVGIELLSGMEISCQDETTKRKVHILAYGLTPKHPHVNALIQRYQEKTTQIRLAMINHLKQQGFNITIDDVLPFSHGLIYKQHIALALEKNGYGSYEDLFFTYFRGPNSIEKKITPYFTPVKDAIEAINLDGGIPVLAHPRAYQSFDQIPKYMAWGLKGIEISHPSYRPGDLEKVLPYDLLHTGGSDYHGQYNLSEARLIGHYGIQLNDLDKLKEAIKQ